MKTKVKVSLVILNWNGRKRLEKCLASLKKITYKNKEIIVVNNGSTDDSADFLKKNYPTVKVIEVKKNIGYAGGTNLGVQKAKGEYVLLLNNDTTVTPGFLEPLVKDMENDHSLGAVQPQIRSMIYPNLLDSVGSFFTSTGFLYHFGYMKPYKNKLYTKPLFAYSIKGACFIMRRKEYLQLGGLDESFICYVEETDLCHRIWLSGKKVMYDPTSAIYHYGGGDMQVMTKDYVTMYRSYRNRIISYIKNFSTWELLKTLPVVVLFSEGFVIMTILKGNIGRGIGAQIGIFGAFASLPDVLKKREYIQRNIRKVSDKQIMQYIKRDPRLSYYYAFFQDPKKYED